MPKELRTAPLPKGSKFVCIQGLTILLFALCILVATTFIHALLQGAIAEASIMSMIATGCAVFIMPAIPTIKRRKACAIQNHALAADAVQSGACAYHLAGVTLGRLAVNALFHIAWVNSLAALLAIPIFMYEGRRAYRGEARECC